MTYRRPISMRYRRRKLPSRRWKRQWEFHLTRFIAGAVLAFVMMLGGCSKRADSAEDATTATPVPDVTVAKVIRAPIADSLMISGNLAAEPNRGAKLSALVPGRIARVLVIEGTAVKDGQTLAELDTTLLREQERQAQATVAQAKATAENA